MIFAACEFLNDMSTRLDVVTISVLQKSTVPLGRQLAAHRQGLAGEY